jgi:hypothetical protein
VGALVGGLADSGSPDADTTHSAMETLFEPSNTNSPRAAEYSKKWEAHQTGERAGVDPCDRSAQT